MGVKRPGREAYYSAPSIAEVTWSYTSISPIRLHGMVLCYSTGQFYLTFTFT